MFAAHWLLRSRSDSTCRGVPTYRMTESWLDLHVQRQQVTRLFCDMKVCHITGSKPVRGSVIHRRGLAKKKGGVGRHITKMVPRNFLPNLRRQRIWVPELKKFVRVRVTARGLKTINKQGRLQGAEESRRHLNRYGVRYRRLQKRLRFWPGKL